MVMICSKCQKAFEPPFDSAEFRSWLDAIVEIYEENRSGFALNVQVLNS